MTEKKRRIPLPVKIILIVLIPVILIMGGIIGKQLYELNKMSALPTSEVISGIYAVNNQMVNMYLIKGDDGYLMIDAGTDKNMTDDGFEKLGISPNEVKYILLTHSDTDHTAALQLFPDAQIYLPKQEVQMIDGTMSRSILGKNSFSADYQTLGDGETAEFMGLSIQCILTPGHTPGSMCYLIDGKYLFTGDSLSLKDGKVALFNSFFNMDDKIQSDSLYMLASFLEPLNPEYIFTAHYGYNDNPIEAFKDWVK